jgi:hypothetical protein
MSSIIETHPEIVKQWHPTKNEELKPENFTFGSNKKVWWLCEKKCPEGCLHEWEAFICVRCKEESTGCSFCSRRKTCIHNSIIETHPNIAKEWHYSKNGDLKPEMFSYGSGQKVWWLCEKKCPEGCFHEWETTVASRCRPTECLFCQNIKICKHQSILYTHPEVAKQWHPTKNGDLKPEMFSHGSDKRIWWLCEKICSEGCLHEWEARISERCKKNNSQGCSFCGGKKLCLHNTLKFLYPESIKQWHPTKNGDLKPEMFSPGSGQKIWWICIKNKNHIWNAIINSRYCNGNSSCPYCFKKSESKLYDILIKKYNFVDSQFVIKGSHGENKKKTNLMYKYDFFIPELNLIIEMDGMQHFKQVSNWVCPLKTQERDVFKMRQALKKGISIIRILQEDIWNHDENFILSLLDKYLIKYPKPKVIYFDRNNLYNNHILLMEEPVFEIPD